MIRGNLGTLYRLNNIGRWLIGVRTALDMSQKEFAEALGESEAQVSRDETNEYHGITVDKVQRIPETFNIRFKAEIEEPISRSNGDKIHHLCLRVNEKKRVQRILLTKTGQTFAVLLLQQIHPYIHDLEAW